MYSLVSNCIRPQVHDEAEEIFIAPPYPMRDKHVQHNPSNTNTILKQKQQQQKKKRQQQQQKQFQQQEQNQKKKSQLPLVTEEAKMVGKDNCDDTTSDNGGRWKSGASKHTNHTTPKTDQLGATVNTTSKSPLPSIPLLKSHHPSQCCKI